MSVIFRLDIFYFGFFFINPSSTDATFLGVKDQVLNDGRRGNPGAKFFVTKKFTDYANEILVDVLDRVGPRFEISDMTFKSGESFLTFTDLKVVSFKSPELVGTDFRQPNKLILIFNNTDVTVNGKFDTNYNGLKADGYFNGSAADLDVSLTVLVNHDSSGRLHVSTYECYAKIKKFDLYVYDAGVFEQIFNALKLFLVGFVRVNVEEKVCQELKFLINGHLDGKLKEIPTKMFLSAFFPFKAELVNNKVLKNLIETFQRLVLDYSLLADPKISHNSLQLPSRSEISFEGVGNTPFFPAPIDDVCEDSMTCLFVSDYVLNSLLWHAYSRDSLNFGVDDLTSENLKDLFGSTCEERTRNICILEILQEANGAFPGAEFKLTIQPVEAPAVIVENDKATIFTRNNATIIAYNLKSLDNVSIVETEFTALAHFFPYMRNNTAIHANFTVEKLHLKLLSSSKLININETLLEKFGYLMKEIIEENLNKFLQNGIRPPRLKEISFTNSNFELMNRRVKIQTDINVAMNDLQQIIDNAMKKEEY